MQRVPLRTDGFSPHHADCYHGPTGVRPVGDRDSARPLDRLSRWWGRWPRVRRERVGDGHHHPGFRGETAVVLVDAGVFEYYGVGPGVDQLCGVVLVGDVTYDATLPCAGTGGGGGICCPG